MIRNPGKPVYSFSYNYGNLADMSKWISKQRDTMIIRADEKGSYSEVTLEAFIQEMQETPWTSFGMPKKYNKEEDTIWAEIR